MPAIDIIDSAGNAYRYELPEDGSVLLIGTGEDCSISLPHITDLLPQHCTISLQDGEYILTAAAGTSLLVEGEANESAVLVPQVEYGIGSARIMYDDGTIAEAVDTPADAPAAPRRKKKKKVSRQEPLGASLSYTEEDSLLHIIFRRLYVIVILIAAFLAGLTMRYWMITGDFLIDELLK